jgi:hypothetical protein
LDGDGGKKSTGLDEVGRERDVEVGTERISWVLLFSTRETDAMAHGDV